MPNAECRMTNELTKLKSQSPFSSLPPVKNHFARRGRRVYDYGKPQGRRTKPLSPRPPDEERSRHFTMTRKTRRRLHGAA
jgi:hypothetical protein